jgi:hypothetical protein
MVTAQNRFLIDAAFIVERIHKTPFGAPLMTATGRDHTFTFGCVRDFLRLSQARNQGGCSDRRKGKEAYSLSGRDSVLDLITISKNSKFRTSTIL